MGNKYKYFLQMFDGRENVAPEWTLKPFIIEDNIYSTDKTSIICFDKNKVNCDGIDVIDMPQSIKDILTYDDSAIPICITYNTLSALLQRSDIVRSTDITTSVHRCKECDGWGTVEYKYSCTTSNAEFTSSETCPICDGDCETFVNINAFTGELLPDPDSICRLGDAYFTIKLMNRLLFIMQSLGKIDLTIVSHSSGGDRCICMIKDVCVVIMPSLKLSEPIFEINL